MLLLEGTKSRRNQEGAPVKRRPRRKAKTELDVILDAFLDFSNEYRYLGHTSNKLWTDILGYIKNIYMCVFLCTYL